MFATAEATAGAVVTTSVAVVATVVEWAATPVVAGLVATLERASLGRASLGRAPTAGVVVARAEVAVMMAEVALLLPHAQAPVRMERN